MQTVLVFPPSSATLSRIRIPVTVIPCDFGRGRRPVCGKSGEKFGELGSNPVAAPEQTAPRASLSKETNDSDESLKRIGNQHGIFVKTRANANVRKLMTRHPDRNKYHSRTHRRTDSPRNVTLLAMQVSLNERGIVDRSSFKDDADPPRYLRRLEHRFGFSINDHATIEISRAAACPRASTIRLEQFSAFLSPSVYRFPKTASTRRARPRVSG